MQELLIFLLSSSVLVVLIPAYYFICDRYFVNRTSIFLEGSLDKKRSVVFIIIGVLLNNLPKLAMDMHSIKNKVQINSAATTLTLLYSTLGIALTLNDKLAFYKNRVIYVTFSVIFLGAITSNFLESSPKRESLYNITFVGLFTVSVLFILMELLKGVSFFNLIEKSKKTSEKGEKGILSFVRNCCDFIFFEVKNLEEGERFFALSFHVLGVLLSLVVFLYLNTKSEKILHVLLLFSLFYCLSIIFVELFGESFYQIYSIIFSFSMISLLSYLFYLCSFNCLGCIKNMKLKCLAEVVLAPVLISVTDLIFALILTLKYKSVEISVYITFLSCLFNMLIRSTCYFSKFAFSSLA